MRLVGGEPLGRGFGYDRGGWSVAREYIDRFVDTHAGDLRGHVLEIGDARYTRRHPEYVSHVDVVHVELQEEATIVCDLTTPDALAGYSFDCIICTQTLQFVSEPRAALESLQRALRPGGILLATMTGIGQISRYDMDRWGEWWHFTTMSATRLFEDVFGRSATVEIESYGNVLAATAQLAGLSARELSPAMLERSDDDYQLVIAVRAQKPAG